MAVSLKSMWNLNHVMQIVAYLRLISNNPANLALIFDSVYNAVTLRPVTKLVFDFGEEKYDLAKEKTENSLEILDIKKNSIFWSLGIFAIVLIGIIIVTLFYYAIRFL